MLESWKTAVTSAGGTIYDYIPDFAFIVRLDQAARSRVASLPFVHWVGPLQPAYKISPELAKSQDVALKVVVQTFPDEDLAAVASNLTDAQTSSNQFGGLLHATVAQAQIANLAKLDSVSWIEPEREMKLYNDKAREVMRVNQAWADLGLYGSGQIVAVADTGLDTGNSSTLSADFAGRIAATYALGRSGNWSDTDAHGTHVAGSVLGNGTLSGSNPASHNYTTSYAGVAPEARLVFQSLLDSNGGLGGIPNDLNTLFQQAYNDGARVHTNSWGSDAQGAYTSKSQQVDQFTWTHKDMTILFAAGNAGVDANSDGKIDNGSVGSPATAKNDITVGASENDRPPTGSSCPGGNNGYANFALINPTTPTFSDVPIGSTFYADIETLAARTILSGATCSGGSGLCFRPNDNVRRGELSKVVRRAMEASGTPIPGSTPTATTAPGQPTSTPIPQPTSTPIPQPTNTPPASGELIQNGDFESGTQPWQQLGQGGMIVTEFPYAGSYGAWLGGYASFSEDRLWQTITIPSNATGPTLRFYLYIASDETLPGAWDNLYVKVRTASGIDLETLGTLTNDNQRGQWLQYSASLSAYRGQTVQIFFRATTDNSNQTSFFIDDVSVR